MSHGKVFNTGMAKGIEDRPTKMASANNGRGILNDCSSYSRTTQVLSERGRSEIENIALLVT